MLMLSQRGRFQKMRVNQKLNMELQLDLRIIMPLRKGGNLTKWLKVMKS